MKPLVCIFAHPDDEAFGPSGTIAKFSKEREVYIICVTQGDAGKNSSDETAELGDIRRKELLVSAEILGVKEVFFLGYKDGELCNNLYHEIAEKVKSKIEELQPDTLLTFDTTGISGHIDHITVSLITSFLFYKLKFVSELLYFGERDEALKEFGDYFIYMPPGFKKDEVDLIVDVSDVWESKLSAINSHRSQKHDAEKIIEVNSKFPKQEFFKRLRK